MRREPLAIAALTVMASTMGAIAWRAWDLQSGHRQAMQCVRPGMTARQVRTVLGRPRTVWYHEAPLQAVLNAEKMPLRQPPSGWLRAMVYPTTRNTRMVVLLDARGRTTAVLDYGT
jgi:hypothetical protein